METAQYLPTHTETRRHPHSRVQTVSQSVLSSLSLSVFPALIFLTASLHIFSLLLRFGSNPLSLGRVLKDLREDKKNFTGDLESNPLFCKHNKRKKAE